MNKKLLLTILLAGLLCLSLTLTACGPGDTELPRSFTVTFDTGDGVADIAPQLVKEGYPVTGVTVPNNPKTSIFRGWFSDKEYTQPWDMETYRVTGNITLYAKWSYPTATPTEFALCEDAFTKSVTWIQTDVSNVTDVTIMALRGKEVPNMVWDDRLEDYVQQGTKIDYSEGIFLPVLGTISADNNQVTFTSLTPFIGGVYKIKVITNKLGVAEQTFEGIRFKGTGTQEDPYLVYNSQDLTYITTHSFDQNTYVKMMASVQISSMYADKRGCVFNGNFDGNGKTITIKNNSGLFYEIGEQGEVYNLKLKGSLSGSDPSIGVVANYNSGYIHDVESAAVSVKSQGGKVNDLSTLAQGGAGGIVGTNKATGRITACKITGAQDNVIQGKIGVGCVAGVNYGKIFNMNVEGIVGAYNGNEISQTINNSFAGCVVGVNYGSIYRVNVDGKINCRRVPDSVEGAGANNVGGVVGYNANGGTVKECFFHGMRCVGDTNVGGIAGYNDGLVQDCYTGRRVRKPSNTTDEERQFISPVTGSYNVGGIVGKCGPNSVVKNVFSTANVWAYGEEAYAVAEKADNAVYCLYNQNYRTIDRWLGTKYGVVYSDKLVAPVGENTLAIDNSNRKNTLVNHLLGWDLQMVKDSITGDMIPKNIKNEQLVSQILNILGDKFIADSSWGVVLGWNRG